MTAELVRLGHQIEVVTSLPNYPRGRFFPGYTGKLYIKEMRGDVCVHRVWLHPAMGGGIGRILNYLTFTLTCLYGVVRCNKPDYLFVESPPLTLSIPAFIASRFWNIPYIFNVADLWPDAIIDNGFLTSGLAPRILSALEQWSYRRASYVNAVTDGIRNVLLSVKKVAPEKVLYLPNGADTRRYRPTPPDLDLIRRLGLEGKQVLLWAGTMGYAHGLDYVLQAAKLLSVDSAIHFVFVGDGSARAQLENLARALNLHNVTFCDPVPVEQLPPYFSIALCGLASLRDLPTHDGARPSKIFPVLASGKPIIFVGKGECARLINEARAGLVVPPENPQAFAAAISTFFADSGALRQCGANGRQFVENHYDWSKLISEWLTQLAASKISDTEVRASHAIANPKA
jgi:glycosyltransferase involved in cell wall biosynthesis